MFALPRLARVVARAAGAVPRSACIHAVARPAHRHAVVACRSLCVKAAAAGDEDKEPVVVEAEKVVDVVPEPELVGKTESLEFQAETKRILEIVANSLYQDKEVFVREIVSNASDALEKRRMESLQQTDGTDLDSELAINITANDENNSFTIEDNGVGMSRDELISNLGTIARSGSKAFMESKGKDADAIIGQFGVGFYSVFMVADHVKVYSRSSSAEDGVGHVWTSDGSGKYDIVEAKGLDVGTKIVVTLKEDQDEFSKKAQIQEIIKRYSSFVSFPIYVDGDRVNTVPAIWTKSPKDVTDTEHEEFFKFISNSYGAPLYKFQFQTDMPLHIQSVFYIPQSHTERLGGTVMDAGVSLYTRSVMIQPKGKDLLPKWLRFVKGVIESDDVPINLSREFLQDSKLVTKVSNIATKRIIAYLGKEAKRDPKQYKLFYGEFNKFLKEGICVDMSNQEGIAGLLRFDSSKAVEEMPVSLEDYVERMDKDDNKIYYLSASNRTIAEQSPYYEKFKKNNKEVLFFYEAIDDVVATHLRQYKNKDLVAVEDAALDQEELDSGLKDEFKQLCTFMKDTLGDKKATDVELSGGLTESPAVITGHQRAAMRQLMRMINDGKELPGMGMVPKLEINPDHSIIKALRVKMVTDPETAKIVTEQLYDNACVSAGLVDDPRELVTKLNTLLDRILSVDSPNKEAPPTDKATPAA